MNELALQGEDRIHLWQGRAGVSIIGAPLGQLVLTSERLLFLSAGTSGVPRRVAATLALGVVGHVLFGRTRTQELDLSALANEGSLAIPLSNVTAVGVGRRLELTPAAVASTVEVRFSDAQGTAREVAFAPEFGWKKEQAEVWTRAIDEARNASGLLPASV